MSVEHESEPDHVPCEEPAIELVLQGKARGVANLMVARVLPSARRRKVGPFVFLDHMGPASFGPGEGFDVRPHPHIGLSTVTYLFEGVIMHRDSLGNAQAIVPGEVNLMTSGRAVTHSERSPEEARAAGGTLHGLQFWVALREEHEQGEPSFTHLEASAFPAFSHEGATVTVLLGSAFGRSSPLAHTSEPLLVELRLPAGASVQLPDAAVERGAYVVQGAAQVGTQALGENDLAVLHAGHTPRLEALTECRVVLLGGPSLTERFIEWNFVSSSKERIAQAKEDWRARRFPLVPGDEVEFIPLP